MPQAEPFSCLTWYFQHLEAGYCCSKVCYVIQSLSKGGGGWKPRRIFSNFSRVSLSPNFLFIESYLLTGSNQTHWHCSSPWLWQVINASLGRAKEPSLTFANTVCLELASLPSRWVSQGQDLCSATLIRSLGSLSISLGCSMYVRDEKIFEDLKKQSNLLFILEIIFCFIGTVGMLMRSPSKTSEQRC